MKRPKYTRSQESALKLWIELSRTSGYVQRFMDSQLRKTYKQTMSRFDVLSQLERAEGHQLPIGQLANQLLASSGNITGLIDRMARDGLLRRHLSDNDRRSWQVKLTKEGLSLFYKMASDHAQWADEITADMTAAETKQLGDLLNKLRDTARSVEIDR